MSKQKRVRAHAGTAVVTNVPSPQPEASPTFDRRFQVAALAALLMLVLAHWPGLDGPFLNDDFPNIVENPAFGSGGSLWQVITDRTSSPIGRPVSMLSFALNTAVAGMEPFGFKLVNLLIHVTNAVLAGVLCYVLLAGAINSPAQDARRNTTAPAWIALAVAATWALGPMQISSVLYVVQRMNLLAATFALTAVLCYTLGRLREKGGGRLLILAFALFVPLAVLSKESGILALGYMWCVEFFLLQPRRSSPTRNWPLLALAGIGAVGVAALGFLWWSGNEDARLIRNFSLTERFLTQGRVLWWYAGMTYWPRIAQMGLFHDDWLISTSVLMPLSTAIAWSGWLALVAVAFLVRKRAPIVGFGILWFLIGHALEAGPVNLELVYEHRNYLPSLGLIVAPVAITGSWMARHSRQSQLAALAGVAAVVITLAVLTGMRARTWADLMQWTAIQVEAHPGSYRANMAMGNLQAVLVRQAPDRARKIRQGAEAVKYYDAAMKLKPDEAGPLLALLRLHYDAGRVPAEALLARIDAVLRAPPMRMDSFNSLMALIACTAQRKCGAPEPVLLRAVDAALSNPSCARSNQALLLADIGNYFGILRGDYARAVEYLKRAVETNPGALTSWLHLARWQIKAGADADAAQSLSRLESLDERRRYVREREGLRRQLRASGGSVR